MTALRYACRSLFKSPGFTAIAILTIAVGIGANTALFSVFDALVLSPLNLPDAGRVVRIWTNNKERNVLGPVMSVPKYRMMRDQQDVFSSIAASAFSTTVLTRDGADPEQLAGLDVTASYIPTLQLPLARGRSFNVEEDQQFGPHVCLISYQLWKTRFGLRESIVNETIVLDGTATTVIGVLADNLPAPLTFVQVLRPWPLSPSYLTETQLERGAGYLQVTARLKPGVTFEKADAAVRAISKSYQQAFPGRLDANTENELRTWIEELVGPVRPTFIMLLTAVGFVLLIACANVSNLFLGRLSARHKEIAVRLSLGATRATLIRQFLLEAAVFCVIAASLGILLAVWSLHGVEQVLVRQLQTPVTLSLNAPTLLFTIALSVAASLAIGVIPSLQASRADLAEVMKESARGTVGGARSARVRGFLIIAEVALSVVLLVGSSLLLVSFARLQSATPGFIPHGTATAVVNIPAQAYGTRSQQVDFYDRLVEALHGYPQVKDVAITSSVPLTNGGPRGVYAVFGRPIPDLPQRAIAFFSVASEEYFAVLHVPLKSGRTFTKTDIDGAPQVCVINESFARRLFPGEDPLGKVLLRGQNADVRTEIIGVVGDVYSQGLNTPAPDMIYQSLRQSGGTRMNIVASTPAEPNALQPLFRSAVASVDRSQAIANFATLDNQLIQSLGVQRVTAWLTGAFAAIALVLSALGLYSVLAYAVTQRTGEIGVRMALGAARGDVIRLVLSQGMRLVGIGLVLGLAAAAAGTRLLGSLLYDVKPLDPLVFGGVTSLFVVVGAAACMVPSWRAARIDALTALRL